MGANPAVSNGSITTMPDARGRIKAVRKRGGRVVVVDPRRTETVRLADQHVAVRPGGDPYLLLGMLHLLFADGLAPARHLDGLMAGWDEVADLVAGWTPERPAPLASVATPDRVSALLVAVGPQGILRRGIGGLALGRVKRTRGGVDLGPLEPGRLRRILCTPDRKVRLAPAGLVAEARRLSADAASELEVGRADATYDLQLIGRRHLRSNNS